MSPLPPPRATSGGFLAYEKRKQSILFSISLSLPLSLPLAPPLSFLALFCLFVCFFGPCEGRSLARLTAAVRSQTKRAYLELEGYLLNDTLKNGKGWRFPYVNGLTSTNKSCDYCGCKCTWTNSQNDHRLKWSSLKLTPVCLQQNRKGFCLSSN